jgi:carbon monoxide dehydrogenase subunit G
MSKVINSDAVTINRPQADIFNFISDFNNFGHLMPEQVVNYQSQTDSCSFEIKGLATLGLRIIEKIPYSKVTMKGEGKLPFDFKFIYASDIVTDTSAEIVLTIDADMNAFMAMMAASPLQNFVNMLAAKLKEVMESMA